MIYLEFWKEYVRHVKEARDVIFYLYQTQIFNEVADFYHFACEQCVLMGEYILASQFLKKAEDLM